MTSNCSKVNKEQQCTKTFLTENEMAKERHTETNTLNPLHCLLWTEKTLQMLD